MYNLLTNPKFINPYFEIGPFRITYYALCLVTGIIAATVLASVLMKRQGIDPDFVLDLVIIVVPIAVIVARLWWVVCDLDEIDSFGEVFAIWEGGLSILGAILGGAIGVILACIIHKKPMGLMCDIAVAVVPLGQAIGRWGNYFNGEVYGQVTDIKWFPYSVPILEDGQYHVALFFREGLIDFLIFAVLFSFMFFYKGKRKGYAVGFYFFAYGLTRAIQEAMRDSQFNMSFGKGLPYMSVVCAVASACGLAYLVYLIIKDIKDKNYWWKDLFKKKEKDK